MSDRFPADIRIGGQLSRTARLYPDDPDDDTTILQGLLGALSADGASHEYGGPDISQNCPVVELLEKYMEGCSLTLRNDQAGNGEFEETEQFCVDHGIPYDRNSSHYQEYDGETAYWRPGMDSPFLTVVNSYGNEMVDGKIIRSAMILMASSISIGHGVVKSEFLERALKLLSDACPQLPPALEDFKIVE